MKGNMMRGSAMKNRSIKAASVLGLLAMVAMPLQAGHHGEQAQSADTSLQHIVDGAHRGDQAQRDQYRNPLKTLQFFEVEPTMTVVEISPGSRAWYMNILAPYLQGKGVYYAASYDQQSDSEYVKKNLVKFNQKVADNPKLFSEIKVTEFAPPHKVAIAPAGSADRVLTFRNVHNWMEGEGAEEAFDAFFEALKPGGILGVVEHRGDPNEPQDPDARSGYVREDYVIELAQEAGFKLVAKSEINANPKDTRQHPSGVWTLPPVLHGADSEADRKKYLAIGESDRMTLKFIKPE